VPFAFARSFDFLTLLATQVVGGEFAVVKFLARRDQVEDDPGNFVGSRGDRLGSSEFWGARARRNHPKPVLLRSSIPQPYEGRWLQSHLTLRVPTPKKLAADDIVVGT
jgi:hypothetical protein